MADIADRRFTPNGALFSLNTRATHSPSSDFVNVSLDYNAAPNGRARGTEVIIPDNSSPQVRAAAEAYNQRVVDFARANGIPDYPNRGVKTRSENGRGVNNTVHTEPFFNTDSDMQRAIQANPQAFSQIYQSSFGGIGNARIIAAHGVGNDRGATSDIFGSETDFGRAIIGAALSGSSDAIPDFLGQSNIAGGAGDTTLQGQQANDRMNFTPKQISEAFEDFTNGSLSPEAAAQYQSMVADGSISLPNGESMPSALPPLPDFAANADVIAETYGRYSAGQMGLEEAAQYSNYVSRGLMGIPAGATMPSDPLTPSADADTRTTAQATGRADPRFAPDLTQQFAAESGGDLALQAIGGLTGASPSPTGAVFPNAPGFVQGAGDVGLAALGGLGAIGGAAAGVVGDAAEAVGIPGGPQLARDLAAVPESLAGSPAQAVRGTASRGVTPQITQARRIENAARGVISEAADVGVNVLTSDVRQPNTFASRWLQGIGEKIPIAGTGSTREAQFAQRQAAITDVVRNYVTEGATPDAILRNVTDDLLATRATRISDQSQVKNEVIDRLSNGTPVDVSRTVEQIDNEVARLRGLNTAQVEPVIGALEDWRGALQGQGLRNVEELRKQIGQVFEGESMASVKDIGEKSLRSIYGPLNEDMGAFIQANGARRDYTQWRVANRNLSNIASELNGGALRNVLKQGTEKPEVVRGMLFGSSTSDVEKLYRNLSPAGRENARAAVMLEAFDKAGSDEALSPTRFANNVNRLGRQVGVVFSEDDQAVVKGLMNVLQATKRADQAAASPPTGVQNTMFLGGAALTDLLGGFGAATASAGGIGGLARVYESKPVRNALIRISGTRGGSPEQAKLIDNLGQIIAAGTIAASQSPQGETTGQQP
jgi:hypothetical protein